VLHGAASLGFIFFKSFFFIVYIAQFFIGFTVCFYSHHQSEFCLHWFPPKSRILAKSTMSVSLVLSAGLSNLFPLLFISTPITMDQLNHFLMILCIVTSGLSFLLLFIFREQPPKGYGLLPMKEQKPEDILDCSRVNSLSMKNIETINPLPPLSPRTSNLIPLPDLTQFNLIYLLFGYSLKLLKQKYFVFLVLIYALNNSTLVVISVFLNILCDYSNMSSYYGSINIFIIAVSGVISAIIHSRFKFSFRYHSTLLLGALASSALMFTFLYLV
jgi:hypothetical protein